MMQEVIFDMEIAGFRVQRASRFDVYEQIRCTASAAIVEIADADNAIIKALKKGDKASIKFGYRDGEQESFKGNVQVARSLGENVTEIVLLHSTEYACLNTRITESYNDEEPAALIKRLCGLAGVEAGKIEAGNSTIPHIIFNNIPVWSAFGQIKHTLYKNGHHADYWIYNDKINFGNFSERVTHKASTKDNIIKHYIAGYSKLIMPLTPAIHISESINIADSRISAGTHRILEVRHLYNEKKTRTEIYYSGGD